MSQMLDLHATDVLIRCNSNALHSFVIRSTSQVVTEISFTVCALS